MPPKKSIYRRPDAQHFQLVHRSQRDPLIHDPDASQHVLKPFHRENDIKKGKTRADLESLLSPSDVAHDAGRENIGEASLYGVYYDDTEYDYMQHLRDPNVEEEGMETIMIEAPAPKAKVAKGKGKARNDIQLRLPPEALPSTSEVDKSQAYDAQQAIPDAIAGFQPDMDPHLRQVLEALEEDAFVDNELDDDFFGELVKDGERSEDEDPEYEFREEGINEESQSLEEGAHERGEEEENEVEEPWQVRFARFQKQQKDAPKHADASEVDGYSESADTVGRLPVIGGKKRRRGAGTESSGFSMTSSAIYRNEGLSTLDERYDQIEKSYEEEEDDIPDDEYASEDDDDEAPDLLAAREDFEAVMDDFLENYELVGKRMRPVLPGDTAAEKLDTIRRALGTMRVNPGAEDEDDNDDDIPMPHDIDEKKDRWDCETILSTYTNLENHPRLIRARDDRPVPQIRLDPRTGIPSAETSPRRVQKERKDEVGSDQDSDDDDDDRDRSVRVTISRLRNESKEEKKARKQAVKQERQARRSDKKATRQQFSTERKHQVKVLANRTPSGIKKL